MAENNEYIFTHAIAKGVQSAPRKTNVVAALVRARSVDDALVILDHTPRRSALAVKKTIMSAKANLLDKHRIDPKTIVITRIMVTAGTRIRRYIPASRGRALPYEKVSSNIFVEVAGLPKAEKVAKTAITESKTDEKAAITEKKAAKADEKKGEK
ncbi:MAG: 50S ribosomal protein L22 [Candidatus Nomurabacteria bacterium]|jgi:large subunit ribosomal protein L22|nr:50S ribosomal protein L22 [Candidatus Nomurabacteria bacterium]